MLIYRQMLGQAMFMVSQHLYYSLHVNIVHGLDQFRSHMIVMDVWCMEQLPEQER